MKYENIWFENIAEPQMIILRKEPDMGDFDFFVVSPNIVLNK